MRLKAELDIPVFHDDQHGTAIVTAAGISIARLLLNMGFGTGAKGDLLLLGSKGLPGGLAEAMMGADIFIGVSKPNIVSESMVKSMAEDPILFALANPDPEILPKAALRAGAAVVGTGRSDFPNQINNVLVFPGIFKGALSVRARAITEPMKEAAARAITQVIAKEELRADYVLPDVFDSRVAEVVAQTVRAEALSRGVAGG